MSSSLAVTRMDRNPNHKSASEGKSMQDVLEEKSQRGHTEKFGPNVHFTIHYGASETIMIFIHGSDLVKLDPPLVRGMQ